MTSPRGFTIWLTGAALSAVGDSVSFFALGWFAAAHGAGAAALVLTVESIPLCVLILAGGALADRYGARRTMIACDLAMALVLVVLTIATAHGVRLSVLVGAALLTGTAAALRRPAEGMFPRLFSTGEDLARRMAVVGGCLQVARVAGPGLGGLVVMVGGLPGAAAFDALTFAVVVLVLVRVHPPHEADHALDRRERPGAAIVAGVRAAAALSPVRAILITVAGLAASVLPLVMLCVPLAGRARGWPPSAVGLVSSAWVAGGLVVTLVVARRGAPRARSMLAGLALAAAGALLLASTHAVPAAVVALAMVGVGTTLVTARMLPAFVAHTPPEMLGRFQALIGLAQTGPVLVAMPLLGLVAGHAGLAVALSAVVALLLLTALPAARLPGAAAGQRLELPA